MGGKKNPERDTLLQLDRELPKQQMPLPVQCDDAGGR